MALGDAAFSNGDIMRRLRELEATVRELRGARRLESSTIGAGGVRVKGEGGIRLQNGGGLTVEDGGDIVVEGGTFRSIGHDLAGVKVVGNGIDIIPPPTPTAVAGDGRLFAQNIGESLWLEIIPPRELGTTGDNRIILGGRTEADPGNFYARSAGPAMVEAAGGSATLQGTGDAFVRSTGGTAWLDGQAGDANVLASGAVYVDGKGGQVVVHAGTTLFLNADQQIQLNSDANQVFITHVLDTARSANCYIGETGIIIRTSSSQRYKTDIEDVQVDPRQALRLRPRTWRDKGKVEADPGTDQWGVGFIAEEVDGIGLGIFVDYDEDGVPQSVAYDRLSVALLEIVKDQDRRLKDLELRMSALDDRSAEPEPDVETTVKPKRKEMGRTENVVQPTAGHGDWAPSIPGAHRKGRT
ncbi:tail fiber domain-containing protein [Amycolatopsis palatopharyngis]|uniref:tail fiber domain-containing protein n=1 Tax=Amycolatopsis palatopharyngis TaxID=187982 RepID=UPI000E2761C8|nr:tail fiber domain-containing protein [Amycolatopsis palatopharyngis]